jgi:hypothetical protein
VERPDPVGNYDQQAVRESERGLSGRRLRLGRDRGRLLHGRPHAADPPLDERRCLVGNGPDDCDEC